MRLFDKLGQARFSARPESSLLSYMHSGASPHPCTTLVIHSRCSARPNHIGIDSELLQRYFATSVLIQCSPKPRRISDEARRLTSKAESCKVDGATAIRIESLDPGLLDGTKAPNEKLLKIFDKYFLAFSTPLATQC
mmetsp:Transcript_51230/g.81276  ORF Transcript_51230/g.81276 Transcript_51230/m.81276 type:complete len:137 (-) Transcript_51230:8-418(-)